MRIVAAAAAGELRRIRRDDQRDHKERENVEDQHTEHDLLARLGQLAARVRRLGGSETHKLRTREGKGGGNKHAAEALEAVLERTALLVPALGAHVVAAGRAAAVDHDRTDDEANAPDDLQKGRDELEFTVAAHTTQVDDDHDDQADGDPHALRHHHVRVPVLNNDRCGRQLERERDKPLEPVVVAHGKAPRGVDEASGVGREGTGHREHRGELTERKHGGDDHDGHNDEAEHQRAWPARREVRAGTDEETRTDTAAQRDELNVTATERALQARLLRDEGDAAVGGLHGDGRVGELVLAESLVHLLRGRRRLMVFRLHGVRRVLAEPLDSWLEAIDPIL